MPGRGEDALLDRVELLVELLHHREEAVHQTVDHLVQQERPGGDPAPFALELLEQRVDRRRRVSAHGHEVVLGEEAVRFDEPILVRRPAVDDEEAEAVVVLELRPLLELLRVLEKIGFVFQSFQLIPTLTAKENIQVPLELRGEEAGERAADLLERVGLGDRGHHYPAQLSGGEQQRVALARAFSTGPKVLFADEPTGNLDARTGASIIDLMVDLNRDLGTTLVLVTHDLDLAARARRTIRLADGRIVADTAA